MKKNECLLLKLKLSNTAVKKKFLPSRQQARQAPKKKCGRAHNSQIFFGGPGIFLGGTGPGFAQQQAG